MLGALMAVIAFSAIPYGTVEPWAEAFVEILLFALGALWCLHGLAQPSQWLRPIYKLLLPLLFIGLYIFLQTLPLRAGGSISYDAYESKMALLKLLAYTFTLGVLLCYTRSNRRLLALVVLVLALTMICALFGLVRQAVQQSEIGFVLPLLRRNAGFAQFINKNHFAALMLMGLGLTWGLLFGRGLSRERWPALAAVAAPAVIALIVCGSRSGVLAMLAQLPFVVLLAPSLLSRERRAAASGWLRLAASWAGRMVLVMVLLAGGVFSVAFVGGEAVVGNFERFREEAQAADETNADRKNIWRSTWKLFERHPLTGVGFGGYWIAISTVHQGSGRLVPQQAHNDYLEILASGGLVGALLCLAAGVVFIYFARGNLSSDNPLRNAAAFGALTGLFGVAVQSLVEFGLHITFNALICTVLIAIATAEISPHART
jgi:O-antigen ligase